VDFVNRAGGSYHRLDLGDGRVIRGTYDMTRYIDQYGIPDDLRGQTVLDVGTASGYFALECAARGADVTAIDMWPSSWLDELFALSSGTVRYVQKDIYDLDGAFGSFDLVICGSLLLHLPDQVGAVRALRRVARGQAVIATSCIEGSESETRPYCEFLGERATEGDYWSYWSLNAAALVRMCSVAGFSELRQVNHFVLEAESGPSGFVVPHVVVSVGV
jgi:2-polyprenyl-3-methyl-5-hydroxy-6-metoxy-1,4-benzoquinol methylase